jgi:hypothetical protein
VSRALEKLRIFFAKRGVVLTTAVIAGTISGNSVRPRPPRWPIPPPRSRLPRARWPAAQPYPWLPGCRSDAFTSDRARRPRPKSDARRRDALPVVH